MTAEEITQYYVDLLILQYRRKKNARATVGAFVRQVVANLLWLRLADAFDLDTAEGDQLDMLAKYIGITRRYTGEVPEGEYFGFASQKPSDPQNPNGFRDYNMESVNSLAIWFQYGFSLFATSNLRDTDFRTLLKLRILTNTTDSTLPGIMAGLRRIFGGAITVTDNADMTLDYTVNGSIVTLPRAILEATLPRPAGVGINVRIVRPQFAFSRYDNSTPVNPWAVGFRRYAGNLTGATVVTYANYNQ